MTNLLKAAASYLAAQLQLHAATEGTYRHAGDSVDLPITKGRSEFEANGADGIVRRYQLVDLIVPTAALVINSRAFRPQDGDIWTETETGIRYQITGPDGQPPYRRDDHQAQLTRIHAICLDDDANPQLPFA